MQIGRVENATRVMGLDQAYAKLPIRDEVVTIRSWARSTA
jgi:hypothetical protein